MSQNETMSKMIELERDIARYPAGSITKKKIKGKDYYYHRINHNGKRTETYVPFKEVYELRTQIEERRQLEMELKKMKLSVVKEEVVAYNNSLPFKTTVRTHQQLKSMIETIRDYRKRDCIQVLRDYIFSPSQDKVFILYGLRRTGKTTMIRQILTELSDAEFNKAAFIQVKSSDTLADVDADIRLLESHGYKYVFIDEVTLMENFIEDASIFSDVYASSGMKIVLSGTDSLGFAFSKEEQLYDRCIMLHTTWIPYREFENVLQIKGIDEYIRYGGTMSLSDDYYNNEFTFSNIKTAEAYIDSAIAKNIQHALNLYQYGSHFRQLQDLYEKGELMNVINRVIENINHDFTRDVVVRTFQSHDLSVTASNLLKDRKKPINIKEHIELDTVTKGIMKMLDILNKEEQSIDIKKSHMTQIKEYLMILDLIMEIDLEFLPEVNDRRKLVVITQPGMRYAQAQAIVENLLMDAKFVELSIIERKRILDRLLSEICGRMMEEIVLLETKMAYPKKKVFQLQFAIGEFDMVVFDPDSLTCQIYEIKHSDKQASDQLCHLIDKNKCDMTIHRYGEITGRYLIYRGNSMDVDGIQYINVEEYLKSLPSVYTM